MFNVGDEVVIAVSEHTQNMNRIVTVDEVWSNHKEYGFPICVVRDGHGFAGYEGGYRHKFVTDRPVLGVYGWKLRPLLVTDTVVRDDDGPLRVYMTY